MRIARDLRGLAAWLLMVTSVMTAPVTAGDEGVTHHVPRDFATIQAAVDAAADGDTVLVAEGTYRGEGNRDILLSGRSITVRSAGGSSTCTIECDGSAGAPHRGFLVLDGATGNPVIEGFTVTGGFAVDRGGGLRVANASPVVRDCRFIGNQAQHPFSVRGGGVGVVVGEPHFIDCLFEDNLATVTGVQPNTTAGGGGVSLFGAGGRFEGCVFRNNRVVSGNLARGGGLLTTGSSGLDVIRCRFVGNSADVVDGGGTEAQGGGFYHGEGVATTVINCLFSSNSVGFRLARGAGLFYAGTNASVVNCTFVGNATPVPTGGGGVADVGGGLVLENCVLWQNAGGALLGPTTTVRYCDVEGGWSGAGNVDVDPRFADADAGDFRPADGSPLIDAGNTAAVPAGETIDLAAAPRFVDDFATDDSGAGSEERPAVDLGAFEYQLPPHLPADVNADGRVDVTDLVLVILGWGACPMFCPADVDETGEVDGADVLLVLAAWGQRDCNTNARPDAVDLRTGTSDDCNANGVPDECDVAVDPTADCDGNGRPDICDLAGNDADGNGVLDVCQVPSNDACGSPLPIGIGSTVFSAIGATTAEPFEPGCFDDGVIAHDVWFRWVADRTGEVTVSVTMEGVVCRLVVYAGDCPVSPGDPEACGEGVTAAAQFPVTVGTVYRVRVGTTGAVPAVGMVSLEE